MKNIFAYFFSTRENSYLYCLFMYNFWLCFCNKCISESKFWWMKSRSIEYWKLEILSTDFLAHIFEKESWANFVFLQRLYTTFWHNSCFYNVDTISSPLITRNHIVYNINLRPESKQNYYIKLNPVFGFIRDPSLNIIVVGWMG